jgi:hypothetical protein
MKIIYSIILLSFIGTISILSQSLSSDKGSGKPVFHVVCIPDSMEPKIKIDGDISDWNWVPGRYKILIDKLFGNAENDAVFEVHDLFPVIIIAWSRNTNKLYLAIKVEDDVHVVNHTPFDGLAYLDDSFEFAVDPGHKGGHFSEGQTSGCVLKGYMAASMPRNHDVFGLTSGAQWMVDNNKYIKWGYKIDKTTNERKMQTMYYEIEMSLWDYWDHIGASYSIRHHLVPFREIRMNLQLNDVDDLKNADNRKQCLTTNPDIDSNWWQDAGCFQDFILDPPLNDVNKWRDILNILQ